MAKASLVLSPLLICIVAVSMASANVVSLTTTAATTTTTSKATTVAPPSYPACDKVPSNTLVWEKKAQAINFYQSKSTVQKDQKFNSRNATFYKDYYFAGTKKTPWSKLSLTDQQALLSNGTTIYLFIDGRPVSLKVEICYDKDGKFYQKTADTVYKVFYYVIPAGTYTGKHDFVILGYWNGRYDLCRNVKVTFT